MKALLAISVALNVLLGALFFVRTPSTTPLLGESGGVISAREESTLGGTPKVETIHITQSKTKTSPSVWSGNMGDLYNQLKAWGAPNDIILAVLIAKDKAISDEKRLAIMFPNGAKRWSVPQTGKETFGKLADMYAERRAEARKVMGEDLDITLAQQDPLTMIKWGNLAGNQVAQIKQITEEYEAAMIKGRGVSGSPESISVQWQQTLDEEYAKDIRSVLGDAQAEDFLTFNSFSAKTIQKDLAKTGIEVDEQTYRALLKATNEVRASFADSGGIDDLHTRMAQQAKVYESTLGASNAVKLAAAHDQVFTNIDGMMTNRPASERMALYHEYASSMSKMTKGSPQVRAQEAQNLYLVLTKYMPTSQVNQFVNSPKGRFLKDWMSGK